MPGKLILLCLITVLLAGCSSPPACPDKGHQAPVKSAGCIVISQERLLVIRELSGKISIPGGSANPDETPRCSAHRETWEETGLNVTPQQRVRTFDNGFHLFHCQLHSRSGSIKPKFIQEVREAFWLSKDQFSQHQWRFPEQARWLKHYLLEQSDP